MPLAVDNNRTKNDIQMLTTFMVLFSHSLFSLLH